MKPEAGPSSTPAPDTTPDPRDAILAEVAALGPPPSYVEVRLPPLPPGWDPADSSTSPQLCGDSTPEGKVLRAAWHLDRAAGHLDRAATEARAPGAAALAVVVRALANSTPEVPLTAADLPPRTLRTGEDMPPPSSRH